MAKKRTTAAKQPTGITVAECLAESMPTGEVSISFGRVRVAGKTYRYWAQIFVPGCRLREGASKVSIDEAFAAAASAPVICL